MHKNVSLELMQSFGKFDKVKLIVINSHSIMEENVLHRLAK